MIYDLDMKNTKHGSAKPRGRKKQMGGLMALDTFGKRLRLLRQDRGLSQIDLRDALKKYDVDIGETYISELERTDKTPTLAVAAGMAQVLGVSLDYFGLLVDDARHYKQEPLISYISPEADEVAALVDEMNSEQRAAVLSMARGLAAPVMDQRRMRAAMEAMLDNIQRKFGTKVREEYESIFRERGIFWSAQQ